MKKSDIIIAFLIGGITALYFMNLFSGLTEKTPFLSPILKILPVVFSLLSIFCLWLAYLLGKKFLFIFQLAKFLLVGTLAAIFDLGILSLFIGYSGVIAGLGFSFFKGISFIIATSAKYFADKFWAFKKTETSGMNREFGKFFIVTIIGLVINVAVASWIVNRVGPQFGLPPEIWANFAGIAAILVTFIWNFISYKFLVFKK